MIAGENFGCGSSREHALWALADWGIRCIIAPSFADIFFANAVVNGVLLITLPACEVDKLMREALSDNHVFSVDLNGQTLTTPAGDVRPFEIDSLRKDKLMKGLDPISETIQQAPAIKAFEQRRREQRPWLA